MKNFGWHMFIALLLADIVALIMLELNVGTRITLIVSGIVFVIIALVMFIGRTSRQRMKKREAEAAAKIADLQNQVEGTQKN